MPALPRLTLHSYWRSSSAWRVRIGLHLKGLTHEIRPVSLPDGAQFSPEHRARNPMAQVPVLEVTEEDGSTLGLVQSMAILEWLEERFPAPPLLPPDAPGRARVRALAEHVNSGIQPYQNLQILRWLKDQRDGLELEWARHWVGQGIVALEAAVRPGAGRFCHGDAPTLADLYLVPQLHGARRFKVDLSACPTLLRVEAACAGLDAFRRAAPAAQIDAPASEKQ